VVEKAGCTHRPIDPAPFVGPGIRRIRSCRIALVG
jgi:hypothetical protein